MLAEFLNAVLHRPWAPRRWLGPRIVQRREKIFVLLLRVRVSIEFDSVLTLEPDGCRLLPGPGPEDRDELPLLLAGVGPEDFGRHDVAFVADASDPPVGTVF